MYSKQKMKLLLKGGINSPAKTQNGLLVEVIYFLFVRPFDLKSKWWLIFLFRPIIYYTYKKNHLIHWNSKEQACCHLATPGRNGAKNWKTSTFFPSFCCKNLMLILVQTIKQTQTLLIY